MYFFCDELFKDIIIKINFVDYGNFIGGCKDNRYGNCGVLVVLRVVEKVSEKLINIDNMLGISE